MSLLTFSDAFLARFGKVVFPALQDNYVVYSNYWKVHSTDDWATNINDWLKKGSISPYVKLVVDKEGWKPEVQGCDEVMQNILDWVKTNITYKSDSETHLISDYWQTPNETLALRTGDCEDGASLIIALAYVAGVPPEKYWLQWGSTPFGGHAYVCYLRDDDAEEVVLDWCYWWSPLLIRFRTWLGDDTKYGTVWGTARIKG